GRVARLAVVLDAVRPAVVVDDEVERPAGVEASGEVDQRGRVRAGKGRLDEGIEVAGRGEILDGGIALDPAAGGQKDDCVREFLHAPASTRSSPPRASVKWRTGPPRRPARRDRRSRCRDRLSDGRAAARSGAWPARAGSPGG